MSKEEKEQQEETKSDSPSMNTNSNTVQNEEETKIMKTETESQSNTNSIEDKEEKVEDDKEVSKPEEEAPTSGKESPSFPIDKPAENVSFKVVFNKNKYDVEVPVDYTIKQLKEHLFSIINVLPAMQKVMIKGLAKDDKTLKELDVTNGSKVMVVGSKLHDVVTVNAPNEQTKNNEASSSSVSTKESWSQQKLHKKIIEKGIPEDALPGIKDCKLTLPSTPLSGMLNKRGGKVRLTFKLEVDQLWIGTKERTEKVNMNHIRQVVSEAIDGHEEYHIMAFQLGPTEASRYWVYWVPAQYVEAIKDTVLGKWQ